MACADLAGAVTWPLQAPAQHVSNVPLIGLLSPLTAAEAARNVQEFRRGLRDLGDVPRS